MKKIVGSFLPNIILGISVLLFSSFCFAGSIDSPFNGLKLKTDEQINSYSILVAGHLYGAPESDSLFPASSILAALDMINASDAVFFVCLGDIYRKADQIHILNFKKSFASQVNIPMFNSTGNHDIQDRLLYEKNFGKTYFDFVYGNSLFIFLDTELSKGEIKGTQLDYFQNLLGSYNSNPEVKNVFIFSHMLIWSKDKSDYQVVFENLNNRRGYASSNRNFKNDIKPYLVKSSLTNKAIYWLSGDIGVSWSHTLFYEKDSEYDITYIATGLGETVRDAIIKVDVDKNGKVKFKPISLTGQKLQPIEYYNSDYWRSYFHKRFSVISLLRKARQVIKHK